MGGGCCTRNSKKYKEVNLIVAFTDTNSHSWKWQYSKFWRRVIVKKSYWIELYCTWNINKENTSTTNKWWSSLRNLNGGRTTYKNFLKIIKQATKDRMELFRWIFWLFLWTKINTFWRVFDFVYKFTRYTKFVNVPKNMNFAKQH